MNTEGIFYKTITEKRGDDNSLKICIENTVSKLLNLDTDLKKPGVLLGKVQSGKTRAFLGVIALAFDNGYDIVLVMTKGTKPLVEQTIKRLKEDFGNFEDDNQVQIHDIMLFPKNLVPYELNQKLVLVAKKEINNLKHVIEYLTKTYPDLKNKRMLIIDDEADFASIGFYKDKETGFIEKGKIAKQIDSIRNIVKKSDYLEVTATPYSLYLQPDSDMEDSALFPPIRPAFTELVPIHSAYIGGDYYFIESEDDSSIASCVYREVPIEELEILKARKTLGRADRRSFKIEDLSKNESINIIKKSIMNFIVGSIVRRIQQKELSQKEENYSFIIHTEQSRQSHDWQEEIIKQFTEDLVNLVDQNKNLFISFFNEAYEDIRKSILLSSLDMPPYDLVFEDVKKSLKEGMLLVEKINSDKDVKALLDTKGQLKLRTPLNIFIGGQILDRGITIRNLIGFYYGRNPKRFQQDTVLQHSRMYGSRTKEDLAVTRFYTTRNIYEIMKTIHEFDNALREAFLNGSHEKGVYFIRKDESNKLVPCSPNKIMLSNITVIKPYKRILPIGFQTYYKTKIQKTIAELDKKIEELSSNPLKIIDLNEGLSLVEKIYSTFDFNEPGYDSNLKSFLASLEYLSKNSLDSNIKGKLYLITRKGSQISRKKTDGRFSDDVGSGTGYTALNEAKELAKDLPALMLIRLNGEEEKGWKGSPFWWPVLVIPENTDTTIFSDDTKIY